jgi:hypothetical protein
MKKLALIAILLGSPAFAEDTPQPSAPSASEPAVAAAPVSAPEVKPQPPAAAVAPAAPPQPTAWNIEGLDAGDLATLNEALESLPMRVYRQFTVRLQQKIKPVR